MVIIKKMDNFANYQRNALDKVRYGSNGARFIILLISALCGMTLLSLVYINSAANLEAQNNILREECDIVRVKNSDLSAHQSKNIIDLTEKSSLLATKEEQLTELREAKVLIQGRLDEAKQEAKQHLQTHNADQSKIQALRDQNSQLESTVDQMESQQNKLSQTISQNEELLQNYRETNEQQKAEYQKLVQLFTQLQGKFSNLLAENQSLQDQTKKANENIKTMQAAVQNSKGIRSDKQVVNTGTNQLSWIQNKPAESSPNQSLTKTYKMNNSENMAPQASNDHVTDSNNPPQNKGQFSNQYTNKLEAGNSEKMAENPSSNTAGTDQNAEVPSQNKGQFSNQYTNELQAGNSDKMAENPSSNTGGTDQNAEVPSQNKGQFSNQHTNELQAGNSEKMSENPSSDTGGTDQNAEARESDLMATRISLAPLNQPILSQMHEEDTEQLKQALEFGHSDLATTHQVENIDESFQETAENKLTDEEDGIKINDNFNPTEPLNRFIASEEKYLPEQGEINNVIDSNPISEEVGGGSDLSETEEQHYRDDVNKDSDFYLGDKQKGDIENNVDDTDTAILPERGIEVGENVNEIKEFYKPEDEYDYKDNLNSDLDNMAIEQDFDVIVGDEDYNTNL